MFGRLETKIIHKLINGYRNFTANKEEVDIYGTKSKKINKSS
jgi:hypothetical protein